MRSGHRWILSAGVSLWAAALLSPTSAAAQGVVSANPFMLPGLLSAGLCCMGLALIWLRLRGKRRARRAMKRIRTLEHDLSEANALLNAEPQILLVWKGKADQPYRMIGEIRGVPGMPAAKQDQHNIAAWLEPASRSSLNERLAALRTEGRPFNVHVATTQGGLLEADGRATGGMATLRIRPVTGERQDQARLERTLAEAEIQLEVMRQFLDAMPLPLWLGRVDGGVRFANRAYLEAVGGEAKLGSEDPGAALMATAHGRTLEIVPAAGGIGGVAIDASQLAEARGEFDLHISAHTRALERLTTAVAIFGPDQRLQFFNPAYAELWQLDPEWLSSNPSDGDILEALREARRLPEQANFRTWKQERLAAYSWDAAPDDWWHLPDGRSIRVIAEKHPSGGLAYIYEDATEKLDLESRYNSLIGVQKETLDHLHEGVALFGSDGRLKLFNPAFARIWRLEPTMLDAEPHISDVVSWCMPLYDDEATWDELVWAVTAFTEERRALSAPLHRPDDTVISFASVPLPDGATLLTYVDITDSTRMELALRERNDALETAARLKSEFVSHVSRQLRLPLTSIIGFAESLSMGIAGEMNEKQTEYIQDVLASSNQLLTLIDDILDLATIDAGRMELKLGPVDVKEVLKSSAALVRSKLLEKGLRLQITVPGNVGTFIADEKRVRQIVFNLLSNAAGFTPRGNDIKLGCKRTADQLSIWVRDSGSGVAPEFQQKAFERFETSTDGSSHRGAGLGLSIVKNFMELHGGTAVLHSTPGEGTMVECRFPLLAAPAAEGDDPGAPASAPVEDPDLPPVASKAG